MLKRHRGSVSTAMSYEGAVDEASFVAGPALVGLLALTGLAWLPLAVAAGLAGIASVAFALHRTAVPAVPPAASAAPPALIPKRTIAVLVAAMVGLGVVFGATQTGVAAFASASGHAGSAGLVYAVLGLSSAAAGFATAFAPARLMLRHRFPIAATMLVGGALSLLLVHSVGTAVLAMALLGLTVAPLLITVYALAEQASPPGRTGAVMTLLASGTVGGVAVGAAIGGAMAQSYGYAGAFLVPIVAALFALVTSRVYLRGVGAQPAEVVS
jgi:MFS family permease